MDELKPALEDDLRLPYTSSLDRQLCFFRDRITELRLLEGISERSLSLDIGRAKSYIQQITSGKITPTIITLFQLCERFSLDPQEFFDPDYHNPELLQKALNHLKKLSDDNINYLIILMEKLEKN